MLLPLVLIILNMADVIAICVWADVITTRLMLLPMIFCILADVIAIIVVDVITTVLNVLADGIAKWQIEWPL